MSGLEVSDFPAGYVVEVLHFGTHMRPSLWRALHDIYEGIIN